MTTLAPARSRWGRRWLRVALLGLALVGVVVVLRDRVPGPDAVVAAAANADPRWLIMAVFAQTASQAMFANQQRYLLTVFAVKVPRLRMLAITYSRSAISMALPAGSAVSAAFAFDQYRRGGASRSTAATVMILSWLASIVGLALLYATGLLTAAATSSVSSGLFRIIVPAGSAAVVVTGGAVAAWYVTHFRRSRSTPPPASPPAPAAPPAPAPAPAAAAAARTVEDTGSRWRRPGHTVAHITEAVRRARTVPARHWAATVAISVTNWLLDLACLFAAAHAFHISIGYGQLAGVYLAAQIARQLPITPGGIGVIEISLITGLVAAGATPASAAAAVLGYRLISFWLVLPIGLATYLGLRRAT